MTGGECNVLIIISLVKSLKKCPTTASGGTLPDHRSENSGKFFGSFVKFFVILMCEN